MAPVMVYEVNVSYIMGKGFFGSVCDYVSDGKRNAIGMAIAHVGDLVVSDLTFRNAFLRNLGKS